MKRLIGLGVGFVVLLAPAFAAGDKDKAKEALQALNEYVGSYKGDGRGGKGGWNEKVSWGWRFKGDACWLRMDVENGKQFKSADLRFVTDKGRYQLTAVTADGRKQVYEGKLKDEYLTLDYQDPDSGATLRLKMNTAADGARFIYRLERRRPGRTLFAREFQVECSKEGESLAGRGKKNECIVTGGVGTIAVSYKGATYYVCCSGCREAFLETPEKFIQEFKKKRK
jgi:hypothetical protein